MVFGLCYFLIDAVLQMLRAIYHKEPQWTFLTVCLLIYKLQYDFPAKKKENKTQQEARLSKSRASDKLWACFFQKCQISEDRELLKRLSK